MNGKNLPGIMDWLADCVDEGDKVKAQAEAANTTDADEARKREYRTKRVAEIEADGGPVLLHPDGIVPSRYELWTAFILLDGDVVEEFDVMAPVGYSWKKLNEWCEDHISDEYVSGCQLDSVEAFTGMTIR